VNRFRLHQEILQQYTVLAAQGRHCLK